MKIENNLMNYFLEKKKKRKLKMKAKKYLMTKYNTIKIKFYKLKMEIYNN